MEGSIGSPMTVDYPGALDLSDPRIGWGGWQPSNRRWIVVHGTAGDQSVQAVQATFISNAALGHPSSTHYAVGMSGQVAQYVPESGVAWGNGPITGPSGVAVAGTGNAHDAWWDAFTNANPETFSIEHCKADSSNADPLTPAQQAASFALIAHLCDRWGIPRRVYGSTTPATANGGITGHFSMDPVNREYCPGNYPWSALQTYLGGGQVIPAGWKDDGTTLTAPNGVPVIHGFRAYILDHPSWDGANVPQAPEMAASPADPANPQGCAGARQYFLRTILVWQECDNHLWETNAGRAAYLSATAQPHLVVNGVVIAPFSRAEVNYG